MIKNIGCVICVVFCLGFDLQTEIDNLSSRGGQIDIPNAVTRINQTINMRGKQDVILRGTGAGSQLVFELAGEHPCIDMVGAHGCRLSDFRISGHSDGSQTVGLLLGRFPTGQNAGRHLIENLIITGIFKTACFYSVASEVNVINHLECRTYTESCTAFFTSRVNERNVVSPHGGIGTSSNACTVVINSKLRCEYHTGNEVMVRLGEGTRRFAFVGGVLAFGNQDPTDINKNALATFDIGTPGGVSCDNIHINSVQFESQGARYAFRLQGPVHGLILQNNGISALHNAILVEDVATGLVVDSSNIIAAGLARYDWGTNTSAILIKANVSESVFDVRSANLARFFDGPTLAQWPKHAIDVRQPASSWLGNKIHIRHPTDLQIETGITVGSSSTKP